MSFIKDWMTTRMGILTRPCTWCGDPVFEDPKVRNAQDGGRHECSITDAVQFHRRYINPRYEEELLEEWYSSDMDSELPQIDETEATSVPIQVGDPFDD
jgi:hypothetical protein